MRKLILYLLSALLCCGRTYAQIEIHSNGDSPMEKVLTVRFGYSALYYSEKEGYELRLHTSSRRDGDRVYTLLRLGLTPAQALESVERLQRLLNGKKLYSETTQKGEKISFAYYLSPFGEKTILIRQESNHGESRLDGTQLTRLRSFLSQKAVEDEARRLRERIVRDDDG